MKNPKQSQTWFAKKIGARNKRGEPSKQKVGHLLQNLRKDGRAKNYSGKWQATPAGKKYAESLGPEPEPPLENTPEMGLE